MIIRIRKFFQEEIWNTSLHNKPKQQVFLIRQLRTIMLAFKGFMEDRVAIRASALTYFTLLSLVPIVAMGFGVAKGFGFDNTLEQFIFENFKGQEEVLNEVIKMSENFLEDVKGGLVAGVGLIILIWSVMQVLTNIEKSFNAIWQIKKSRSFFRKLADYLSIMLIGPLFIILSSVAMVAITKQVNDAGTSSLIISNVISPALQNSLKVVPYLSMGLAFTLLYMIMPNTKVNFKNALVAGILAGVLFQLLQWGYVRFQIGVTKFGALYGTFAALPLFLVWLQLSWLIVLLGAEISFAYQNVDKYEFEAESLQISHHNKRVLSLLITHYIIKKFEKGDDPPLANQIGNELGIPIRLMRDILFELVRARILVETATESEKEKGYQPAIDINKITLQFVSQRLDDLGSHHAMAKESKLYGKINELYDEIFETLAKSTTNLVLKDIQVEKLKRAEKIKV